MTTNENNDNPQIIEVMFDEFTYIHLKIYEDGIEIYTRDIGDSTLRRDITIVPESIKSFAYALVNATSLLDCK